MPYITLAKDLTYKKQIIRRLIVSCVMIPLEIIILLTIPYYIFIEPDAFALVSDLIKFSVVVFLIFGFTLGVFINEMKICIKRLKNKSYL